MQRLKILKKNKATSNNLRNLLDKGKADLGDLDCHYSEKFFESNADEEN